MKYLFIALTLWSAINFLSCTKKEEPAPNNNSNNNTNKHRYWKLVAKEIGGLRHLVSDPSYTTFPEFPFNIAFNDGNVTYTYTGKEGEVTRTDVRNSDSYTTSIKFLWSIPPIEVEPDQNFSLTCESIGTAGNGIGISRPTNYKLNTTSWYEASYRNGAKTATVKMDKPDDNPDNQKLKITVQLSTGNYFMQYIYVYQWIP